MQIEQLGLQDQLVTVDKSHPAARNRYIYLNGKLHRAPSSLASAVSSSFSSSSPFSGLLSSVLREPFIPRSPQSLDADADESVDSFVSRRFGSGIAENVLSALVHGIYAGDTRDLSVRSVFPSLWNAEKSRGSVVRSMLSRRAKAQERPSGESDAQKEAEDRLGDLANSMKGVSVYSLKGGLEGLPKGLVGYLGRANNVQMHTNTAVESISYNSGKFEVSNLSRRSSFA